MLTMALVPPRDANLGLVISNSVGCKLGPECLDGTLTWV